MEIEFRPDIMISVEERKKTSIIQIMAILKLTLKFHIHISGIGMIQRILKGVNMMNKNFDQLIRWIETGNEMEFTYEGKRYSITYGKNKNQQEYISFCEFYGPDTEFYSVEDFTKHAKIDNKPLCDIWNKVTQIDVF